jgi:hypothetical protein
MNESLANVNSISAQVPPPLIIELKFSSAANLQVGKVDHVRYA